MEETIHCSECGNAINKIGNINNDIVTTKDGSYVKEKTFTNVPLIKL